jgi:hypothetical protein
MKKITGAETRLNYTNAVFAVSSRTKIERAGGNMPKDATKNVDRYKVRGGQLNEFDFTKNQEQVAQRETKTTKGTKANKSGSAKKRKAGKK